MITDMTGIILAGGKSSRMGEDKPFLDIAGKNLIENAIDTLKPIFQKLIIVANAPDLYRKYGIETRPDIIKGRGPLGGIYTGLVFSETQYNFVIACDMPFINKDLVKYMIEKKGGEAVIAERWGAPQPLCGIYSKSCVEPMKAEILENKLRLKDFLKNIDVKTISEKEISRFDTDGLSFTNINTREDYESCRLSADISYR